MPQVPTPLNLDDLTPGDRAAAENAMASAVAGAELEARQAAAAAEIAAVLGAAFPALSPDALSVLAGVPLVPAGAQPTLMISPNADRTAALPLAGRVVPAGPWAIFVDTGYYGTAGWSVEFESAPPAAIGHHVENAAPFDAFGTDGIGQSTLAPLPAGAFTATAVIHRPGQDDLVLTAPFTVV